MSSRITPCTHANTALGLYEAHGFAEILSSLTVEL
jgi:hypothetical protein